MATSSGTRRYAFIDSIRGVAACLVMVEHALEAGGFLRIRHCAFALSWLNPGEIGVVAFFFVSGFVIPLSLEKWNNIPHFWLNRILRIYPLYACAYLAGVAVVGVGHLIWDGPFWSGLSWSGVLLNLATHILFVQEFFHTPNFVPVAWTLSLEAVWYAGITLLFVLGLHRRIWWVVALSVLSSLLACALALLSGVHLPMGRLSLLLVSVIGMFCFRRECGDVSRRNCLLACAVVGATIALNLLVGFALRPSLSAIAPSFRCVAISWTIGAAIFFVPYVFRAPALLKNSVLTWLGKISYSIYLIHALVIMALSLTPLLGGAMVMAIFVVTIGLSSLSYRFIEYPIIAYSHALRPARAVLG